MKLKFYFFIALAVFISLFGSVNKATAQNLDRVSQQRMVQQIELLEQEKNSRTPAQQKIASQLLQAAKEKAGQKFVDGVDLEAANVNAKANGDVELDVDGKITDALLSKIKALGGKILYPSARFNTVRISINLSLIEKVAELSEVRLIQPAAFALVEGSGFPDNKLSKVSTDLSGLELTNTTTSNRNTKHTKPTFEQRAENVRKQLKKYFATQGQGFGKGTGKTGSINSQGDRTHRADDVRSVYGFAGQGVKIGVMSDSYNATGGAPADVLNGDLPGVGNPFGNITPVTVVQEGGTTDEGRAMMQIVHDLVPKAQLFFATGNGGAANFANNILQLRNTYNCDIIIDDLSYSNEPVFEDGTVAQAVITVTAGGALYFSSAANSGSLLRNSSGVYEADFNDAGSPAFTLGKAGTIHNFGTVGSPINGDIITATGQFYSLQWSDKTGSSGNDYDLFLVTSAGTVKSSATTTQAGSGNPYEQLPSVPALVSGDRLVVLKTTAAAVRAFSINTNRGRLTIGTTGQTHGHASVVAAFCVAATPAAASADGTFPGPYPNVFVNTNRVESFSSDGPRTVFYNPDGTPATPGNFTFATGGSVRQKPDITAANGVSTTLPAASGLNPFYGTSASAPHAGAIAALLKSAKPSITPAEVRTALTSTALDIEGTGYDINSGYGILQAFQAMQFINPPLNSNIILGTVTPSEGTFNNGNGAIDPGEIGNVIIQLKNPSLATATNVNAVLTSTTAGVIVTQANGVYGSIVPSGTGNNATPYTIIVPITFHCGDVITFNLTVTFGGGGTSPQTFPVTVKLGKVTPTINATIGVAPPAGAGYTVTSGTQTDRVSRNTVGVVSSCAVPLANPGVLGDGAARQYHAYKFTNTTAVNQCVTVTVNAVNFANIFTVAYDNNGFVPTAPSTNFLADAGNSFASQTFTFTSTAGQSFTIVISDVTAGAASNTAYTLDVSLANCSASPCTQVVVGPATIAGGTLSVPYSQAFSATGGSGAYTYALSGTLPTGLTFAGNTLSGTPTQSGTFPITVTVTDAAGCPTGTKNYNLVIASAVVTPTAIAATAGTPQSAIINTAFATALKATVTGTGGAPASGATVTFTAPGAGASGTFPGASLIATAVTDASGVATAPTFTANGTVGGPYNIAATVTGVATAANFALTNLAVPACVLTCPANITTTSTPGQCGAVVNYPAPTTTGGCGTVTSTPASGSVFPLGVTTVNVSSTTGLTCSFTITVSDNIAPTVTCPGNATANTDAGVCTASVATTNPTATDNCAVTKLTWALTGATTGTSATTGINNVGTKTFNKGVTTITYTATDAAGNSGTCSFTVTVSDAQAPTVTCPGNLSANTAAGLCSASVVTTNPTTADNCGAISTLTWALTGATTGASAATGINNLGTTVFNKGITTVTYTAKDADGNSSTCSFTVTVNDTEAPTITCPANVTAATGGGICTVPVTFATPTATDNCSGVITIISTPASGSSFPIGVTTVTSKATDAAGNFKTCTFTVTVTDGQPASITTQPVSVTGCAGQSSTFTVVASNAVSYQWQVSAGGGAFANITGATSATLVLSNITFLMSGNQYRVIVNGPCSSTTSAAVTLTVKAAPAVTLTAASYTSINPSVPTVLYSTVSPTGSYSYKWIRNGATIPGVTTSSLKGSVDLLGAFQVVVTDNVSGCATTSNIVTIKDSASGRLFVYPNPNNGVFQARFYNAGGTTTARTLNVYDDKGARVFSKQYATSSVYERMDVNISAYGAGIYMIEVRDASGKKLAAAKVRKQ